MGVIKVSNSKSDPQTVKVILGRWQWCQRDIAPRKSFDILALYKSDYYYYYYSIGHMISY